MSIADTMMHMLSEPWRSSEFHAAPTPLPGLRPTVIEALSSASPDLLNADVCQLLRKSCGIAGTALGDIDFTGQWYPEEPLVVLRPSLTLAVDDRGRRWLAEARSDAGLPGPVWCLLPDPPVTVYVSRDLKEFLTLLHNRTRQDRMAEWLRGLRAASRVVWARRELAATSSYNACRTDGWIRGWLSELPFDVHVYDLRAPSVARGWPHGLAGPGGRLYRCGRLPVFAVAGSYSSGEARAVREDLRRESAFPGAAP
ncbi:MAG: hypothetical protein JWL65_2620 [Gammaproteobacteria bacterium]|jgi:hypothetical protein|nr:hypothetical protein [Gammaproteobacteria bacterium]